MLLQQNEKIKLFFMSGSVPTDTLLQFFILLVAVSVPKGFLFHIFLECFGKVNACLISKTDQYPQNVSHFITQILVLVAFLFRLLSVPARNDPGNFTNLLCEHGHVCELVEIPYSCRFDPLINFLLGILNSHILVIALSTKIKVQDGK
jgi:hypothetical protein